MPNDSCTKTLEGDRIHWRSHPGMAGNLGFAILTDEKGAVRFTYDVNGEVDFGSNGYWQEGIRYRLCGAGTRIGVNFKKY